MIAELTAAAAAAATTTALTSYLSAGATAAAQAAGKEVVEQGKGLLGWLRGKLSGSAKDALADLKLEPTEATRRQLPRRAGALSGGRSRPARGAAGRAGAEAGADAARRSDGEYRGRQQQDGSRPGQGHLDQHPLTRSLSVRRSASASTVASTVVSERYRSRALGSAKPCVTTWSTSAVQGRQ